MTNLYHTKTNPRAVVGVKLTVLSPSTPTIRVPLESTVLICKLFLMSHPGPLFIYFRLFKQTLQFSKYVWKMSIQYKVLDLSPRLSEHESPPITTRPGFPPTSVYYLKRTKIDKKSPWMGHFKKYKPNSFTFVQSAFQWDIRGLFFIDYWSFRRKAVGRLQQDSNSVHQSRR